MRCRVLALKGRASRCFAKRALSGLSIGLRHRFPGLRPGLSRRGLSGLKTLDSAHVTRAPMPWRAAHKKGRRPQRGRRPLGQHALDVLLFVVAVIFVRQQMTMVVIFLGVFIADEEVLFVLVLVIFVSEQLAMFFVVLLFIVG